MARRLGCARPKWRALAPGRGCRGLGAVPAACGARGAALVGGSGAIGLPHGGGRQGEDFSVTAATRGCSDTLSGVCGARIRARGRGAARTALTFFWEF